MYIRMNTLLSNRMLDSFNVAMNNVIVLVEGRYKIPDLLK